MTRCRARPFLGGCRSRSRPERVAIVTGGTGDLPVALEAARTLAFHGEATQRHVDIGVAGLWRLLERREILATFPSSSPRPAWRGLFSPCWAGSSAAP